MDTLPRCEQQAAAGYESGWCFVCPSGGCGEVSLLVRRCWWAGRIRGNTYVCMRWQRLRMHDEKGFSCVNKLGSYLSLSPLTLLTPRKDKTKLGQNLPSQLGPNLRFDGQDLFLLS